MKILIVFVALFAFALADHNEHNDAVVVKSHSNIEPDHYSFHYETSDGKSHQEEGNLKHVEGGHHDPHDPHDHHEHHEAIVVHGSYSWKDKHDGQVYTVKYVADEHGFQPEGEHLPQIPQNVH